MLIKNQLPITIKPSNKPSASWIDSFEIYTEPAMLRMLGLGFSAGLPLLLVLGTLSFWASEAAINIKTIGHLSWIGLAYSFKWVWSPLVDHVPIPILTTWLGQRRSWLVVSQIGVVFSLLIMATIDPASQLHYWVYAAIAVAVCSATQDIALDALRIESADENRQASLSSAYQIGYRIAMIWAGAGALSVAAWAQKDTLGYTVSAWHMAYTVMACSMIVGLIAVAFTPKTADSLLSESLTPLIENNNTSWNQTINNFFKQSLITPFKSFVERFGIQDALIILLLVSTYRISDIVMGVMANPFYVSMKFSKLEVASITKVYGVIMTLAGASVGGLLCIRWGVLRIMLLGAILSALTNCLFSGLATLINEDPDLKLKALTAVISADNFASGIAATAFIAYMSNLTSKGYSATQYALLSSLMVLFPKYIAGLSGGVVENIGYVHFFNGTALMGVPVIMLLLFIIYSHRKTTTIN